MRRFLLTQRNNNNNKKSVGKNNEWQEVGCANYFKK